MRSTRAAVAAAVLAGVAVMASTHEASACTTGVFAGAATADGRPLLWKNRDASDLKNQVVYRDDGRIPYVGVVNRGDTAGLEIWAGLNAAGFAIMNSASYNLEPEEAVAEGQMMRAALQSCRTVADFERLLETTNGTGHRSIAANFGVIDAEGGAAYFETSGEDFVRFDAAAAPGGYLVRSNFSFSGKDAQRVGITREARASELVAPMVRERRLDARRLLAEVSRDVANASIGSYPLAPAAQPARFAWIGDSINRESTASVMVVAGVKPGENPLLATAWVLLGQPISGVAVPLWPGAASVPAELAAGRQAAPLNAAFDEVRSRLYPDLRADRKRYLDTAAARTLGIPAVLVAIEAESFAETEAALARWRREPPDAAAQASVQDTIAARTLAAVTALQARWGQPALPAAGE